MSALSVNLQIQNAAVTLLQAEGSPAPVDFAATLDYTVENVPVFNVAEKKWDVSGHGDTNDSIEGVTEFSVLCYAQGNSTVNPRAAVDPLVVWAHQQLMKDETLGGLCRELLIKGGTCNYDRKDGQGLIEVEINVMATYDTKRGDPSQNYNDSEG